MLLQPKHTVGGNKIKPKIGIILGTRPEIIKLSPVIRACEEKGLDFCIIHTNQHFSPGMDEVFFKELKLPQPKYNLKIRESLHGQMTGKMLSGIEEILLKEKPDWVLVQGDTNTVLAGALAASKLNSKVGHVEAGLRSYDRSMPEEINRVITDHISEALFCPTKIQSQILLKEGISKEKIYLVGNTIVDAVEQNLKLAEKSSYAAKQTDQKYLLLTMHRPANVDVRSSLTKIIRALEALAKELKLPIVFPVHPRTKAALQKFSVAPDPQKIHLIEPVGYLEMLLLMKKAELIITDSGGIQEEACVMRIPCITIRDNTERPETVIVGANVLVGTQRVQILAGARLMLAKKKTWRNPLGDGTAGKKIVETLCKK